MNDIHQRIDEIVRRHKVVLFMKGTPPAPRCEISARALQLLKRCGVEIEAVDVLADPAMREGLKEYSGWPTFPQVYIASELAGGSDLLADMYDTGELQKKLGIAGNNAEDDSAGPQPPSLTVSRAAQRAFAVAREQHCGPGEVLRFDVSPAMRHSLCFGPERDGDIVVRCGTLAVHVSPRSAARLDGTTIDFEDGPDGRGFTIDNPNATAPDPS